MKIINRITPQVEEWSHRHGYDPFKLVHPMFARVILLECESLKEIRAWGVTRAEPFVVINPRAAWVSKGYDPFRPITYRKRERKK